MSETTSPFRWSHSIHLGSAALASATLLSCLAEKNDRNTVLELDLEKKSVLKLRIQAGMKILKENQPQTPLEPLATKIRIDLIETLLEIFEGFKA